MYIYLFLLTYLTSCNALGLWSSIVGTVNNVVNYIPVQIGPEDAYLDVDELASKYGYTLEDHNVTTEDGYILKLHRIPHGRKKNQNGLTIFLMHGISDSSDSWLLLGPGKALAYILADKGYDVWMGNARGNKYSMKHVSLNANMSKYWKFGWEEIGLYDLSAMIDYTLNHTRQNSLYYIGYSQGTTTFFTLMSLDPKYNDKVKLMFSLAPEVFMGNAFSPLLRILSPAQDYLNYILSFFNIYSSSEDLFKTIGPLVCNLFLMRCDNFFYSIVGPNNVSEKMWPIVLGHSPTGSSTFQYIHYGQLVQSEKFCRFDYGKRKNREIYGQDEPPEYNLKNVTAPVIMFYGGRDWFSDKRDAEKLIRKLPNIKKAYYVKSFGHLDYVYADEAEVLVYDHIIRHLNNAEDSRIVRKV